MPTCVYLLYPCLLHRAAFPRRVLNARAARAEASDNAAEALAAVELWDDVAEGFETVSMSAWNTVVAQVSLPLLLQFVSCTVYDDQHSVNHSLLLNGSHGMSMSRSHAAMRRHGGTSGTTGA